MAPTSKPAAIGPAGYRTAYDAFLDLIAWGPGAWGKDKFLVVLFHAERTARWGKPHDRHSTSQVTGGVFSRKHGEWVRGARAEPDDSLDYRLNPLREYQGLTGASQHRYRERQCPALAGLAE